MILEVFGGVLRYALQHAEQGCAEDVASEAFLIAWPGGGWTVGAGSGRYLRAAPQRLKDDVVVGKPPREQG